VSDVVGAGGGEAIGNLSLFQARSAAAMAAHLDDLALLVPYVLTRLREDS
jgi:hypothetical protein